MPNKALPDGWRWTSLSDVARLESGHTPSRKHPEYWGGEIPWIGIKDATENYGRKIQDTHQHTNELGIANSSARVLPPNTVCLSRTASVGYVVVMGRPMATSQDFVNWVCSSAIDYRYLKYILISERESFLRFASGTTHQTIYFPEVKGFHVALPPIEEQRAIACVLGALDDKIELNRRMNETLEATARALFKSWFVDFDPVRAKAEGREPRLSKTLAELFPNAFEESELGAIPKGWEIKKLGDLFSLQKGLSYKGEHLNAGGVSMVNLGCFVGRGRFETRALKQYSGEFQQRHIIHVGDLVLANTDITQKREVIGSPGIVPPSLNDDVCIFTHHVFAARFNNGFERWRLFAFYSLLRDEFRDRATGFATGTTVLALPQDAVLDFQFAAPLPALLDAFSDITQSILARKWNSDVESCRLAELRDALLPKLISGELQLMEAERHVGATL
jgi:type I restriction enzyme S subunit